MIRVCTGSRLHFGLFALPTACAGDTTLPRRRFGGVGMMSGWPGIELTAEYALTWRCEGPLAERALAFARKYCDAVGIQEAFHIKILRAAPEHAGLGTGTQLGLGIAYALAELTRQPVFDPPLVARQLGRGARSALGVHGFHLGGFLIEAGKVSDDGISTRVAWERPPEHWQILLITPRELIGMHGRHEIEAFAQLAQQSRDESSTDVMCRLALLGMLPAILEKDLPAFGAALYEYNRRAGEMFSSVQGGIYAHPRIEAIIKTVRGAGVTGVGQSSWGPTVFAITDEERGAEVKNRLIQAGLATAAEMALTPALCTGTSREMQKSHE